MADQNDQNQNDQAGDGTDSGVSDEDARQLLNVGPDGRAGTAQSGQQESGSSADDDDDPEGSEYLGDPGKKALTSLKERNRAIREERDRYKAEFDRVNGELRKHSDKDKSELQRAIEERDALKTELGKVASAQKRRDAAEDYAPDGAEPALIRAASKYINGDTEAELKAAAEEFYSLVRPSSPKTPVPGKPKEGLRGGGNPPDPTEDNETDPAKLAARIPRAR